MKQNAPPTWRQQTPQLLEVEATATGVEAQKTVNISYYLTGAAAMVDTNTNAERARTSFIMSQGVDQTFYARAGFLLE